MKKISAKDILIPTVSLVIICFVISLFISATNFVTKDIIKQQELENQKESRKVVLQSAVDFKEYEAIDDCYIGYDENGKVVGYTFITQAKGYGGAITVMTGISSDAEVQGVEILLQNETPGLGANAENSEFKDQYKQNVPKGGFKVIKSKNTDEGEIEAITGATISSKAVTEAVNSALDRYNSIAKDGGVS